MPRLWQRVEAHQAYSFSFRRMASGFVTAALALTILLGVYMAIPPRSSPVYPVSYLQALADANTLDTPDIVGPVSLDLTSPDR